ncbi:uncharacterized protein N7515_010146 [Penicillium bovifimosum]|uniref:Fungal N-terminal domain-containing protein n=1 Tax=Penicillium bovifimosum TaxID=126998 RepID=A0A9W9KV59_9EURO|nr:uncharacterized protein N7515_010146 [Penicillium bovifimosum]KAJ5120758.1 hypothetical protein N7515_010146 [Penicillium bovifimosum]
MAEPTNTGTSAAEFAKAAQCSICALVEIIEAAEYRTEAVKELFHLLSSINKAMERFVSTFDKSNSCKLSHEVQLHLQMATRTTQHACARFQEVFTEWTSHFIKDSLRDSDWNLFGAFVDIQSRILSGRLRQLKDTMNMAMEISALVSFPASRYISDEEWNSILKKENTLLSAIIKTNESQQTHQRKERAAERIACEIKGSGIAMQRDRKIFDGLLAEFSRLRWSQITKAGQEGQLQNAVGALPGEIQWSYESAVISIEGITVARFYGSYNDSDALSAPMVRADDVPETAH